MYLFYLCITLLNLEQNENKKYHGDVIHTHDGEWSPEGDYSAIKGTLH